MLVGTAALTGCAGMNPLSMADATDLQAPLGSAPLKEVTSPQTDLEKATEYWGKQYAANPGDANAVVSYAKNLKAMGRKKEALAVLQQSHRQHASNREHLSEYGRLALEFGQVSTAKQLLERADDPANPDWRVISARGTVLAREGHYKEAIATFERAQALAPGQASVLNNLAMAHALNGEAARAEVLLREAAEVEGTDARVRQNLALVLGVQGKYGEAKTVASVDLTEENAQSNVDFLRKIGGDDAKVAARTRGPAASVPLESASPAPKPQHIARAAPRAGTRAKPSTASSVATSSIGSSDPDEIISAAILAEAAKGAAR